MTAFRIPFRLILIAPFVSLIMLAVGLTGFLSFRNGREAIDNLAAQLQNQISERIQLHLHTYLDTPHTVNQLTAASAELGLLDITAVETLDQLIWRKLQQFPTLTSINISTVNHGYIGSIRRQNGSFTTGITDPTGVHQSWSVDEVGQRVEVIRINPNNPYRERLRYTTAVEVGSSVWTDIHVSSNPQILRVWASEPIYDQREQLIGVASSSLSLSAISDFLRTLTIGHGLVFVIDRSGQLIASSTTENPFQVNPETGKPEQLSAMASENPLIQATAKFLLAEFNSFEQITSPSSLNFQSSHGTYYVLALPYIDPRGLDWVVMLAIPESDFMAQIEANTRTTIGLCLVALAVATGVGLIMSDWVSTGVRQLTEATETLAAGHLTATVQPKGIHELHRLGQAFNQMADQLRASFRALEQINNNLEERVAERTAELQTANREITRLNDQLHAENQRMGAELEITRQLQQMILPMDEELAAVPGLDIAGFMEPANEVGGDYFDVLRQGGRVKIGIGDVTGHGLESGVLMIMAQTAVRSLLAVNQDDLQTLLVALNQAVYGNIQRMHSDKNMSLALIDYYDGVLTLSGQHEEMVIFRQNGRVERVDTIDLGFPIGLEPNIQEFMGQHQTQLEDNDVVILFTDGITEAENAMGAFYGIDRLCQQVSRYRHDPAAVIRQQIIKDLKAFIGDHKIYDDITLVVFKKKSSAQLQLSRELA